MKLNKLIHFILFLNIVASASFAQADGLISNLLGGKDANFKSLLTYVPTDTAFIFANKEPVPDEVMNFHIKRGQEIMAMVSKFDKKGDIASKQNSDTEKGTIDSFLKILLEEVTTKINEGKVEDTGLSLRATSVLYGLDMQPVIRLTFSDKDKIMGAIKHAEKASEYKLELSKCGEFDCFYPSTKAPEDKSVVIVILKNHLAVSIFSKENKEKVIVHLTGKELPKTAYSEDKWDSFLKENGYNGNGDGYLDIQKIYQSFKPLIVEGITNEGKVSEKELKGCTAVVDAHIENLSEIVFGTRNLETKNMDYELIVKTSSIVSDVLQGIANKANINKRLENPVFDLGVNINFVKMRDALMQYTKFLSKSGKENNCKSIDEQKIQKSMGGLMLAMNMGLTQLKSLYFGLNNVDLGSGDAPKQVDALLSVGTDDPAGLIGMLSMLSPALRGFQLPKDGSTVELPSGAISSRGLPLPPIFLSSEKKLLNIMIGDKMPKLLDYAKKVPEIMSFSMDGKRYYEVLGKIITAVPKSNRAKANSDNDIAQDVVQAVGKIMGRYQQEITADKRGLIINYHIDY